jgi:hypothetical protein
MRLSIKAMTIAWALLWAGCVLVVGLANLVAPAYGLSFLQLISSIYPGYHASRNFVDVLVGTGYAIVDGGIGGLVFAWLYNLFVGQ